MSVSLYQNNRTLCRYKIDKLVNEVYLVTQSHTKFIAIDKYMEGSVVEGNDAYITNLSETPTRIKCLNVTLSEEESLDERYKFQKTLKFTVKGYWNVESLLNRYHAIVKTFDGTFYFVNPEFPARVTYEYRLSNADNETEFTFTVMSNFPALRVNNYNGSDVTECEGYFNCTIDKFKLIDKNYVKIDQSNNKITTLDGKVWSNVEYNRNTFTYTESYDGEKVESQIDFVIPFDYYKTSWHYNLLEFTDNRYVAWIKPSCTSDALFVGVDFGLEPSYAIDATTTNSDIHITLRDAAMRGVIKMTDPEEESGSTSTTWVYVENVGSVVTYECVAYNKAKYLVQQELDATGKPTGNYKALAGHEFPSLNITGTFSNVVEFYTTKCSYIPPVAKYKWQINYDVTDYICSGTTKYYKEYYMVSYDNGTTWQRVTPEESRISSEVIETSSSDCQITEERWVVDPNDYLCQDCVTTKVMIRTPDTAITITGTGEITYAEVSAYTPIANDIIIYNGCTSIGAGAFSGTSASVVRIPNTVTTIGEKAFLGAVGLFECPLPNSITSIGKQAFYGCTSLSYVDLPDTLTSLGEATYQDCLNFASVTIPSSLSTMPKKGFYNCDGLIDIEMPTSITAIGDEAFAMMDGLYTITFEGLTPPSIGTDVFKDARSGFKIYVKNSAVAAYKAAWPEYENNIVGFN